MEPEHRVLVVESDAPLKRSLENFLERAGYIFDCCSSAREALSLVNEFHHDVVIVEYLLPDANAAALLEQLKRIVPHAATIMISEYDFRVIADELVRVEVESFLKKPFDVVDFEVALSSACMDSCLSSEETNRFFDVYHEGVPGAPLK
ncbi:hypothetical protein DSTSK_12690 [Desulforhabdus sp. TSK]|nr:hypothetical protein DSTSK_12690 [Desulforhabdus sp. TSK]